jgi:rhodanese-related sulfurtransferase
MQAWAGKLSDVEIDDLVALLRSWAPVTAEPQPHDLPKGPVLDGPIVINPDGKAPTFHVKGDRFVPATEVAEALKQKRKMVIIDARAASDWNAMHIPGSVSVPYYTMDELGKVPNDGTWVLTYCACPHHASGVVLDELRKRGYKNTAIIDEGILFWQQHDFPIEGQAPPKVPRPLP